LARQFQRAQLPVSSSPGIRSSSARGTGTSEPRRNPELVQHAPGITDPYDRDGATAGRRRRRRSEQVSASPERPSHRTTAAGTGCRAARACGEDALEMAPNPEIQTAHVQSDGF